VVVTLIKEISAITQGTTPHSTDKKMELLSKETPMGVPENNQVKNC
jgi:hypothetical protein